jgi:dihydrofolate reductase
MAKLIYSAIVSLDGYVEDTDGKFDWSAPDEEVLTFINTLERPVGTYLYGRRMYETMIYWENADALPDQSPAEAEFAKIWMAAEKIVYSRRLEEVSSTRTKIQRSFEADTVGQIKATAQRDIAVAGAELAAQAIKAGLVDELHLLVTPVTVGGGKPAIPSDFHLKLQLLDLRRFESGVVHLRYCTTA